MVLISSYERVEGRERKSIIYCGGGGWREESERVGWRNGCCCFVSLWNERRWGLGIGAAVGKDLLPLVKCLTESAESVLFDKEVRYEIFTSRDL